MSRCFLSMKFVARRAWLASLLVAALLFSSLKCQAQISAEAAPSSSAPRLGDAMVTRYRVGVKVTAARGGAQKIRAMVAVPLECEEQQVQLVEENYSPEVRAVDFRMLPGDGARQMLVQMPRIDSGRVGEALITYDVTTYAILPPLDTSQLVAPRRPSRELKRYLGPSPYIDVNHRRIKAALAEALQAMSDETQPDAEADGNEETSPGETAGGEASDDDASALLETDAVADDSEPAESTPAAIASESNIIAAEVGAEAGDDPQPLVGAEPSEDWRRAEAIYDYAIDRVAYKEGVDKSAVQVLAEGEGDCQAIGALFVAMCRTADIPARLVWVHDHQYAEFYLEDAEGEGHWYPIETAGQRAFAEMPLPRVILQKGDDFRVPERPRERLRYASDYLLGFPMPGGGKPKVKYIREQL